MPQSKIEIESRAAMAKFGLRPIDNPVGDNHHTDAPFTKEDGEMSELAYWLGGLFIDKEGDPSAPLRESYFYNEMTSLDVWKRVARALRVHGLQIVNRPAQS